MELITNNETMIAIDTMMKSRRRSIDCINEWWAFNKTITASGMLDCFFQYHIQTIVTIFALRIDTRVEWRAHIWMKRENDLMGQQLVTKPSQKLPGKEKFAALMFSLNGFIGDCANDDHCRLFVAISHFDSTHNIWIHDHPTEGDVVLEGRAYAEVCMTDRKEDIFLAASTAINNDYIAINEGKLEAQVLALRNWCWYLLKNGFEHVEVFLDFQDETFETMLRTSLQDMTGKERVSLVRSHVIGRDPFFNQGAMNLRSLWMWKGHAKWLALLDVDEYFQPLLKDKNIRQIVEERHDQNPNVSSISISSYFWSSLDFSQVDPEVQNLVYRQGKPLQGRRQKGIYRTAMVDLTFVHKPLYYSGMIEKENPTKVIRLNHFKGFGKQVGSIPPCNVADWSFQKYWKGLQENGIDY